MAAENIHRVPGSSWRIVIANMGFGLPIIVVGILGFVSNALSFELTLWAILAGVALILAGLFVSKISVPFVRLMNNETRFTVRQPSLKPPFARILLSFPFFIMSGYVIGFTNLPYVLPFILFLIGAFFYFRGVAKFWINQHTIYFVTDRGRVVYVYRFLGLTTNEIRINANTAVAQKKSFFEMITGRGNIQVSNGPASSHQINWREIDNPAPVVGFLKGHVESAAGNH